MSLPRTPALTTEQRRVLERFEASRARGAICLFPGSEHVAMAEKFVKRGLLRGAGIGYVITDLGRRALGVDDPTES